MIGLDWLPVTNTSGETIPSFAVMKLVGTLDADGCINVAKPDADGTLRVMVNGEVMIRPGGRGKGHFGTRGVFAYDQADGTPDVSDDWGVGAGSWVLKKGKKGWLLFGGASGVGNGVKTGGEATGTGRQFHARLVELGTGADAGRWRWQGLRLTPAGYAPDTSNTSGASFTGVPLGFSLSEDYGPKVGQHVVMWQGADRRASPDEPQYEFLPVSEADDTHPGIVSLSEQFVGDGFKKFRKSVLVNADPVRSDPSTDTFTFRVLNAPNTGSAFAQPPDVLSAWAAFDGGTDLAQAFVTVGSWDVETSPSVPMNVFPDVPDTTTDTGDDFADLGVPLCVSGYVIAPQTRLAYYDPHADKVRWGKLYARRDCPTGYPGLGTGTVVTTRDVLEAEVVLSATAFGISSAAPAGSPITVVHLGATQTLNLLDADGVTTHTLKFKGGILGGDFTVCGGGGGGSGDPGDTTCCDPEPAGDLEAAVSNEVGLSGGYPTTIPLTKSGPGVEPTVWQAVGEPLGLPNGFGGGDLEFRCVGGVYTLTGTNEFDVASYTIVSVACAPLVAVIDIVFGFNGWGDYGGVGSSCRLTITEA